jgi:DNA-directed RNA polymerase specialized sigma24 family protein
MAKKSSMTSASPSQTQALFADWSDKKMRSLAIRTAPGHPHLWDDMTQVGWEQCHKSMQSWDKKGSFGGYSFPMVRHRMRRVLHKDAAEAIGDNLQEVIQGKATVRREQLTDETYHDTIQGRDDAPTPEDEALANELKWAIRKAVWRAARNANGIHEPWRYAYVRNMVLANRMQVDEFCERYGKYRASLYCFQKRIWKHVQKALEEQGLQP